jgi:hypothetical protein
MPTKKTQKKTRKSKKFHVKPDVVVDTTHMANKEEQKDNPLGRIKMDMNKMSSNRSITLPEGFKTADSLTEVDDLKFENGKLREMLVSWLDRTVVDGVTYQVMVDPMNRLVVINREL